VLQRGFVCLNSVHLGTPGTGQLEKGSVSTADLAEALSPQ
jgi:hypothetical protein